MASEPIFCLIRDGHAQLFESPVADMAVFRHLFWGPEALEQWVCALPEVAAEQIDLNELDPTEIDGVVLDLDRRRLVWTASLPLAKVPKTRALIRQLVQAANPGFDVRQVAADDWLDVCFREDACPSGDSPKTQAKNGITASEDTNLLFFDRYDSVQAIVDEYFAFDDDDERDDEDDGVDPEVFPYDDDDPLAWFTTIDSLGAVRHRVLPAFPIDLLSGTGAAAERMKLIPATDIPPEIRTFEGMWIDESRKQIGYWGDLRREKLVALMQKGYPKWKVQVAAGGYADQCAVSGPSGAPCSDAESLGTFLPFVLSVDQLDFALFAKAIGSGLRQTAFKATGCLWMVLCLPVVLFGLISGDFQSMWITMLVMAVILFVGIKFILWKVRSKFNGIAGRSSGNITPVAGPIESTERRQQTDALLLQCGLPSVADCKANFDPTLCELLSN